MKLTVQDIVEAFKITGMKPLRKSFGDGSRGCGMLAYARAHDDLYAGKPRKVLLLTTGRAFFEGFTTGWDKYAPLPEDRLIAQYHGVEGMFEYLDGLEVGRASAKAVFSGDITTGSGTTGSGTADSATAGVDFGVKSDFDTSDFDTSDVKSEELVLA